MPRALVPVLLALLAALALAAPAAAQAPAGEPTTLTVVETASVRVAPDAATILVGFRQRGSRRETARGRVDAQVRALLGRLDALEVPRADVQTPAVELRRVTVRSRGRRLVRYDAVTALEVRVRAALVEEVLAAAARSAARSIEGPFFVVEDDTEGRARATRIALERARTRADAAAAALGQRVVGVRSVELDPRQGEDPFTGGGGEARQRATPVEPGRQLVSATVSVVFVLGT